MKRFDIILCSADKSNLTSRDAEICIRLPRPIPLKNATVSVHSIQLTNATKGPVWVFAEFGNPTVISDGQKKEILGVYHCDGGTGKTYCLDGSNVWLPLGPCTVSSVTLRLVNPVTNQPITFHRNPLIVAHLQIVANDLNLPQ